ncbi:hypothetical protein BV898_00492 [Hypsibius exemplaris]|uniref:Uncharacterized protein n=1 Tax=Hypsibius exemplaris TaxID=2072580 RepID=A0A1W0XDJ9_HYPEX|nr:hypothetical protein BV898_00492 [Hypsibius exemplaris]
MSVSYDGFKKIMEGDENASCLWRLFRRKEPHGRKTKVLKQQILDSKSLLKLLRKEQQAATVRSIMLLDYIFMNTKNCPGNFRPNLKLTGLCASVPVNLPTRLSFDFLSTVPA